MWVFTEAHIHYMQNFYQMQIIILLNLKK